MVVEVECSCVEVRAPSSKSVVRGRRKHKPNVGSLAAARSMQNDRYAEVARALAAVTLRWFQRDSLDAAATQNPHHPERLQCVAMLFPEPQCIDQRRGLASLHINHVVCKRRLGIYGEVDRPRYAVPVTPLLMQASWRNHRT